MALSPGCSSATRLAPLDCADKSSPVDSSATANELAYYSIGPPATGNQLRGQTVNDIDIKCMLAEQNCMLAGLASLGAWIHWRTGFSQVTNAVEALSSDQCIW